MFGIAEPLMEKEHLAVTLGRQKTGKGASAHSRFCFFMCSRSIAPHRPHRPSPTAHRPPPTDLVSSSLISASSESRVVRFQTR